MIYRSETKEIAIALHLTREIEKQLDRLQAQGTSLSDKVKSFEYHEAQMDEDTFYSSDDSDIYDDYNQYAYYYRRSYREHKNNLLGGYYKELREIAHERNQIMHMHKYYVTDFRKFKNRCRKIIEFLQSHDRESILSATKPEKPHRRFTTQQIMHFISFIAASIFMIWLEKVGYIFIHTNDKYIDYALIAGYFIFIYIVNIFFISLTIRLVSFLLKTAIDIRSKWLVIQIFYLKNKVLILSFIFGIIFWNMSISDIFNTTIGYFDNNTTSIE